MASAVAASGSATPQWIRPLNLSKQQKGDLVEFLRALTSPGDCWPDVASSYIPDDNSVFYAIETTGFPPLERIHLH